MADVFEADATQVRVGQSALVSLPGSAHTVAARVRSLFDTEHAEQAQSATEKRLMEEVGPAPGDLPHAGSAAGPMARRVRINPAPSAAAASANSAPTMNAA